MVESRQGPSTRSRSPAASPATVPRRVSARQRVGIERTGCEVCVVGAQPAVARLLGLLTEVPHTA